MREAASAGHEPRDVGVACDVKRHAEDQPDLVERQDGADEQQQSREAVPHALLAGHRRELGADEHARDDTDGQEHRQLARSTWPRLQCVMLPGIASMAMVVRLVPIALLIG